MASPVVVVASGDYYCQTGWSANSFPSVDLVDTERELASIQNVLRPGGWAFCGSERGLEQQNKRISVDEREALWHRGTETFFSSTPSRVVLLDTHIESTTDRTKAAEFFFESLNVPHLSIVSEATASLNALQHLELSCVSPNDAKQRRTLDLPQTPFPFTPSFSGIIITSDFEMVRLQPFFSGLPAFNLAYQHPLGERVPKAILYAGLHPDGDRETLLSQCVSASESSTECCSDGHESAVGWSADMYTKSSQFRMEKEDVDDSQSPLQHTCCWRLARFLYDQCCFVSFDADMDSWLVQKYLTRQSATTSQDTSESERDHDNNQSNMSVSLQRVASVLPYWDLCPVASTQMTDASSQGLSKPTAQQYSKRGLAPSAAATATQHIGYTPCCLCSKLPIAPQRMPQRQRDFSQSSRFDNQLGCPWGVWGRREWRRLLGRYPTLDQVTREALREHIFLSPEVLFQPQAILSSLYNRKASIDNLNTVSGLSTLREWDTSCRRWAPSGLPDAILSILDKSPIDLRRDMYSNIIVLGNLATLPYFAHRLVLEVQAGIYNRLKSSAVSNRSAAASLTKLAVNVWTPVLHTAARYATWVGTKELAEDFSNEGCRLMYSMSREEYEECGRS